MAKTKTTPETNPAAFQLKAVIDLGSTSIRMVVAQVSQDGSFQLLDSLNQSVAVGSDTFTRRRITRETIESCVKVLRNFSTVLAEYNIDLQKDVRAVATSAVREARNRDEFLDRVYIATDIAIEVIEGAEVNRLTFLGIQPLLRSHKHLQQDRLLVAEVGGGTTELLGLENGRVSFAHSYRMGSFRLREIMDGLHASEAHQLEVLEMEIASVARQLRDSAGKAEVKSKLLLMGGEARFAAGQLLKNWDESSLGEVKVSDLDHLADKVLKMDPEQVARKYHLTFEEAQTLGPALKLYIRIANTFGLKRIYACGISLRDGLLSEAASGNAWTEDFVDQILYSAHEVGRRYQMDEAHADYVTESAVALFRALQNEHRLDYQYEVILSVAAQLHDIGIFICNSSHHKHGKYLVENSDIFGLGQDDLKLAALVVRYHRGALPRSSHSDFSALSRQKRLIVNKLAAILRVADALDRSRTQSIRKMKIKLSEAQMVIEAGHKGEFAAERRAISDKGNMFEQVYGRTIVLRAIDK